MLLHGSDDAEPVRIIGRCKPPGEDVECVMPSRPSPSVGPGGSAGGSKFPLELGVVVVGVIYLFIVYMEGL